VRAVEKKKNLGDWQKKKNGAQGGKSFTLLATCLLFNFKAEAENGNKSIHTSAPKGGRTGCEVYP